MLRWPYAVVWAMALFLSYTHPVSAQVECHSCFADCRTGANGRIDPKTCDCEGDTCSGPFCFAKIEVFPEEYTAVIQKGCATEIPGGQAGCQYAGHADSIHCYCEGERCNSPTGLNDFKANPLPTVECCECSEPHGDHCPGHSCLRKCQGNYCLLDFDGVEQGCGTGYPRLQNFLRTKHYADWQGQMTCARYQASLNTIVHGCTCTQPTGGCNEYNKTRSYALREMIERRLDRQNYCYSLQHKAQRAFGPEVFKKSDTCEGQYCFISLTTSELIVESANFEETYEDHDKFVAKARPRFELLAGCLKVDSDEKVQIGCFKEYQNASEPLTTHCICESHLCNFHHLLTGGQDTRRRTTDTPSPPVTIIDGRPRPPPINASSAPSAIRQSVLVALSFLITALLFRHHCVS